MFGSKDGKQERIAQEADVLRREAVTQAELARRMGVHRSTIITDLVDLEDQGYCVYEAADGTLRLDVWWICPNPQ